MIHTIAENQIDFMTPATPAAALPPSAAFVMKTVNGETFVLASKHC